MKLKALQKEKKIRNLLKACLWLYAPLAAEFSLAPSKQDVQAETLMLC